MSTLYLIRHGQASYGVANYDRLSPLGIRQAHAIGVTFARSPHLHPLDALYSGPLVRQRGTADGMREAAAGAGRELPAITPLPDLSEYPAFELLRHWVPKLVAEDPAFAALAGDGSERSADRELASGAPDSVVAGAAPASSIALLDRAVDLIIGKWGRGELTVEGVESIHDFVARVRRALDTIFEAHGRGARVAAVTSGGVIGVALQLALGLDPDRTLHQMKLVRNASISEFAWRPGQFSMIGFNHVHHLGEAEMITFR